MADRKTKKSSFVSASVRERSPSKTTTKPVALSAATKKNIAAYLASTGVGSSDGIPKYLRKPASGSVSGSAVGVGRNSPLTKTSLATNPKRALDSKEWKMAAEGATGISDKNSAGVNAALAAMAFLPVPGLRNIGKVAAGAGKVAATGAKVVKPAAAGSRTAAEKAAIRKGMQNAKTPEVSAKLDAGNAKITSTTPAKFGRAGEVELRTPKPGDAKMATDARVSKFQMKRAEQQGGRKRTAKEQKRYQEDLQNSLSIGARMRAEGRTPGLDVGGRGNAAPTLGSKPPVSTPKPTPKEAIRETAAAGLRKPVKPRNPGRAGSEAKQQRYKEGMAKYEKDLAAWEKRNAAMASKTKAINEGRLKPDGTPKGATAKSIARNQRTAAKKAGAEGPKKSAATSAATGKPKPSAALATRPGSAVATRPVRPAPKAGSAVVKERGVPTFSYARPTTSAGRRKLAIEGPKGPNKPLAIGAGRTPLAIGPGKRPLALGAAAKATGAGKGKKRLLGAAAVLGAVGAAGYAFQKSDAGKGKNAGADGAEGLKRQVLTDKYGRQIGRTEYNRREKYRASIVGKTPKQVAKLRKAEMKRREEFRNTDGKKRFGSLASKKSKNLDVPVGVPVRKKRQGPPSPQNIRDRERFK